MLMYLLPCVVGMLSTRSGRSWLGTALTPISSLERRAGWRPCWSSQVRSAPRVLEVHGYFEHDPAGITKENEITGPNASPTVPDYVTNSIGDLRALL